MTIRAVEPTASADHRASRRWLVATSIRGMQAVGPCRRMPRGSRVTAETRKIVRDYYHIVLRFALAVIALCVLHVGEQTVVSWSHAVSSSPHAAGLELLASHSGGDSHDVLQGLPGRGSDERPAPLSGHLLVGKYIDKKK